MRIFLANTLKSISKYSLSLDQKSILVDQPWVLFLEEEVQQKLIFKKNGELIMSNDGQVSIGKWEYLTTANSLILDRGNDKILCNIKFVDRALIVIRKDGNMENYYVLGNENLIPDLNVYKYLQFLRYKLTGIRTQKLIDGRILEFVNHDYKTPIRTGMKVEIDSEPIRDGEYQVKDSNRKYLIQNGVIEGIYHCEVYQTNNNGEIVIYQSQLSKYSVNDKVYKKNFPAPDGYYQISGLAFQNIVVKDGIIIKKTFF